MNRGLKFFSLLVCTLLCRHMFGQVDARLLRFPDVSETQITFVYAGDIWVAPKEGGLAQRLSSPKGEELFPRFFGRRGQYPLVVIHKDGQDVC